MLLAAVKLKGITSKSVIQVSIKHISFMAISVGDHCLESTIISIYSILSSSNTPLIPLLLPLIYIYSHPVSMETIDI